jgi:hypothetical protein
MSKSTQYLSSSGRAIRAGGVVILLALGLAGCKSADRDASDWDRVLADAAISDRNQPSPSLTPIDGPVAHLVTWRRPGSFGASMGPTSIPRPIWATVEGDLWRFCSQFVASTHPDSVTLRRRVERLLGLQDGDGEGRVLVQFSVPAHDVFRPCPDPSVTATHCDASYDPSKLARLIEDNREASQILLMQMLGSYARQGGYPFTRRGYTYDWDTSAGPYHVGLSEYVTRIGAPIEIERTSSLEDYCVSPDLEPRT